MLSGARADGGEQSDTDSRTTQPPATLPRPTNSPSTHTGSTFALTTTNPTTTFAQKDPQQPAELVRLDDSVLLTLEEDEDEEEEFVYSVLGPEQLKEEMDASVAEVQQIIKASAPVARLLLLHHSWDKESLLEKFYEEPGNALRLMLDAGVDESVARLQGCSSPCKRAPSKPQSSPSTECGICLEDLEARTPLDAGCGHRFCFSCYQDYIQSLVLDGALRDGIRCPELQCGRLLNTDLIDRLLATNPRISALYAKLLINLFVESHPLLRWCPAPGCSFAIRTKSAHSAKRIACKCGAIFCSHCGEDWHEPASCQALAHWLRKSERDGPTLQWIATNTKECPKCRVPIEKDGGCNHVLCKNASCKHDFCWVCLGPWESHGSSWYSCNRYDATEALAARDAQKANRMHLSRYLHYYSRFVNHRKSIDFEKQLYEAVKQRAEQVISAQPKLTWVDLQFLQKAVDVLLECRQTLKHTYVFAYYLKKCNQGDIFDGNQSDLETATEMLSEYLERDITTDNFADVKQKVHDKLTYCSSRRKVLVDHVNEGNQKGWWTFEYDTPENLAASTTTEKFEVTDTLAQG